MSGFRPLTLRELQPPRCGVRAKGRWARPFAIRALRQPALFPHSAATASRTARIRHPWLIPLSQRHPCRFVLAVTLRSALRMALNTLACRSFFFFSVRCCLGGRKRVCEDSGWLGKTEDRRFLVNTARAGWYLKAHWHLETKKHERGLLNAAQPERTLKIFPPRGGCEKNNRLQRGV